MESLQMLLLELTEKERKRDHHFKWFIIDLVINLFFSSWMFIALPVFFAPIGGVIGAIIGGESGAAAGAALGGTAGFVLGIIAPVFYFFAWIYHLVRWLSARGECAELNRKKTLLDYERERERERLIGVYNLLDFVCERIYC